MSISCMVVLMKLNLNRGPCIQPPASDSQSPASAPQIPLDLGSSGFGQVYQFAEATTEAQQQICNLGVLGTNLLQPGKQTTALGA